MIGSIIRGIVTLFVGATIVAGTALAAQYRQSVDQGESLAGRLLVASPQLSDPNFDHSVVYMIQHDRDGAMGLVVNRVMATGPMGELLKSFGLESDGPINGHQVRLHYGGPVDPGSSFVLHSRDYHSSSTIELEGGVAVTDSNEVLRDLAAGKGPAKSLLTLGYAGWGAGQLEREITTGSWVVVDPDPAILFDDRDDTKWQRALTRHGVDL